MALEPVAAAMEFRRSAFACDLYLRSRVASEFCALTGCGDFKFGNRIHADAIRKLLVDARVGHGLAIDCEVVLICALAVKRGRARNRVCRRARYSLKKPREITSVEGDVQYLPSGDDAGTFGRHRFELNRFGFDGHRFAL